MKKLLNDAGFFLVMVCITTGWIFVLWSGSRSADDRSQLVQELRTVTSAAIADSKLSANYTGELDERLNAVVKFVAGHPGKKIPAELLTLIPTPKFIPLPPAPRAEARVRSKSHGRKEHKK